MLIQRTEQVSTENSQADSAVTQMFTVRTRSSALITGKQHYNTNRRMDYGSVIVDCLSRAGAEQPGHVTQPN